MSKVVFNERVEIEVKRRPDVPSIVFEGDNVGHLLYVLRHHEYGIKATTDGPLDFAFKGGALTKRLTDALGYERVKELIQDFEQVNRVVKRSHF